MLSVYCINLFQREDDDSIYQVSEEDGYTRRLHFIKFETKYINQCLDFIRDHLVQSKEFLSEKRNIKATGGGAHKYKDQIVNTLGVEQVSFYISKSTETKFKQLYPLQCTKAYCTCTIRYCRSKLCMYKKRGTCDICLVCLLLMH